MEKPLLALTMLLILFFAILPSTAQSESSNRQAFVSTLTQIDFNVTDTLNITVNSSKPLYDVGSQIQINGSLELVHENSSFPLGGQLIALQVNNRIGPYFFRTLETAPGTTPSQWQIEIKNAYIGDGDGNPLTSVVKGSIVYTWLTYYNNWNQPLHVEVAYTVVDDNNIPLFTSNPLALDLLPGFNYTVRDPWRIPNYAADGNARLIANAFSSLPSLGGFPYCPEFIKTFIITSQTTSTTDIGFITAQETGTYETSILTSKKVDTSIPYGTWIGNYTIYVAAKYGTELRANSSATFQIRLAGDVDGVRNPSTGTYSVNILDAIKLSQAFGSKPGDSNWNPKANFNGDDKVNILDSIVLSVNFGNQAL